MADVRSRLFDWSVNASSNLPSGTTVIGSGMDDNMQQLQATVRAELANKGLDIPSAATLDLSFAGSCHDITGNVTIQGAGSLSAGMWKVLQFNSTATLKHSASLILPSRADITAQPGDCLYAFSLSGGIWRVGLYQKSDGRAIVEAGAPVGVIEAYAGSSAPVGYLMCDGSSVSRTTYAALFAVIGTTYGSSSASVFNVPDLRGRSIFGVDNMGGTAASRVTSGISGIAGTALGSAGGSQLMHGHTHTITDPGHTHTIVNTNTYNTGVAGSGVTAANALAGNSGSSTTGISIVTSGSGASQNMPPAIMLNYIIKAA